ncbi:hypothetical protein DM02DRAFT_674604 [Periconia macrospinosa]|uniref:Zn(2)-C6 fungal-type domain-containing protein n=1 Tax=Periconia macrospinosa TaxID=97972 RepID=A0A2V1DHQ0_9PLEO|nr:hypothetical protein DM02DRAFT_674604 [Periconia macrospinosa]
MPQTRAARVCEYCHAHKIRCDVVENKTSCSRCVARGEECKIRARKLYSSQIRSARRRRKTYLNHNKSNQNAPVEIAKIVAASIPEPSSRIAPIFVGDGGYGAILDSTAKLHELHFYIPAAAEKSLATEDLQYLKVKGCFTLPPESADLITAYFRFVHPMFPVIDGASFLSQYNLYGFKGVNLLLLWSIFSVSVSYVPNLQKKKCKEEYTNRAKLLFDLTHENDKTVLIQSALLLSFWFADTEDVKHSWYWTSVAFGIAQTLGLYREFRSALWRTIWKCCQFRDVWLAFGMGRPLRINIADCDRSALEDAAAPFTDLMLHGELIYSQQEAIELGRMWQSLNDLTDFLREVITTPAMPPSRIRTIKNNIDLEIKDKTVQSKLEHVHWHLRLHQQAVLIASGRISGTKEDLTVSSDNTITTILECFQNSNSNPVMIQPAPLSIPLIVPAMTTYLSMLASEKMEDRNKANQKLDILVCFLRGIEDNYPAASILNRVCAASREPKKAGVRSAQPIESVPSFSGGHFPFALPQNIDWLRSNIIGPEQGS